MRSAQSSIGNFTRGVSWHSRPEAARRTAGRIRSETSRRMSTSRSEVPPRARQRSGGRPSIPILQGGQGMDSTLTVPKQGAVCAVYARKSTEQNGVGDEAKSVARQIDQARAY